MTGQASLLALQPNPILLGEGLFLEVVVVVNGFHCSFEIRRIRRELKQGIGVVGVSDEVQLVGFAGLAFRATPTAPTSGTSVAELRGSDLVVLGNGLAGRLFGGGDPLLGRLGVFLRPSPLSATPSPTSPAATATRGPL
jgi:hypothetical protein